MYIYLESENTADTPVSSQDLQMKETAGKVHKWSVSAKNKDQQNRRQKEMRVLPILYWALSP